jgi:hypothetical protein
MLLVVHRSTISAVVAALCAGLLPTIQQASRSVTAQLQAAMQSPTPSSSSIFDVLADSAATAATLACVNTFRQLYMKWPGTAPLTSAALRPCFQPVVDLAWAVLQAAAAAGLCSDHGSSSSSSSSSSASASRERGRWDCHVASAVRLATSLGGTLGLARLRNSSFGQWRPHAQQFSSDVLLKLLMVPVGILVGQLHEQQQQQQQPGQVCVQPYHQQLLAELQVIPNEHQSGTQSANGSPYNALYACAALAFASEMQLSVLQNSSSGISSDGSGSELSAGAGTAAQPAAAATAAGPGISSRLCELLLLTVLEYAVLVSTVDVFCVHIV